jgi:hypothetical protein
MENKYIGKKINNWTIESFNRHSNIYNCICACGTKRIISVYRLISGYSKSCGCSKGKDTPEDKYYKNYIQSAKTNKRLFKLNFQDFLELTSSDCHYCGVKPFNKIKNSKGFYLCNGIDRLDSNGDYVKNNVVSCCKNCNYLKLKLSKDDFLNIIKRIYEHMNKEKE